MGNRFDRRLYPQYIPQVSNWWFKVDLIISLKIISIKMEAIVIVKPIEWEIDCICRIKECIFDFMAGFAYHKGIPIDKMEDIKLWTE